MESQRDFPSPRFLVPFHLSDTQVERVSECNEASGSPYQQANRHEPSGKELIFVHSFLVSWYGEGQTPPAVITTAERRATH